MTYHVKRGEIYYADLNPIKGSEQSGGRPVLIISNDVGNRYSQTVIVAAISGIPKKMGLPTHYLLPETAVLEIPSIVLLEQLRTIDKLRLEHYMGELDESTIKKIDHALAISIGLEERARKKTDDAMLLTLCGKCVSQFYDIPEYVVHRANLEQDFKETCCYCGCRKGWDYRITNRTGRKR